MDSLCEALVKIEIDLDDDTERDDERIERIFEGIYNVDPDVVRVKVVDTYTW